MDEARETFSDDERHRLRAYFTNLEDPVFGLRLPQEVAGALFSRYSRSARSLRRVFLEEFLGDLGLAMEPGGDAGEPAGEALRRARAFYERVLVGYGDDSVAQLGGAHVACERISNVAARLLEDGRVGVAYLEKSTRYVRFDQKGPDGAWLFHRDPGILGSRHRDAYLGLVDALFSAYARQVEPTMEHIRRRLPIESVAARHPVTGVALSWDEVSRDEKLRASAERAYAATVRAHACDVMRSYLPAATLTNVGVFASGQAYEHLLTKLLSQPLEEGRALAGALRRELDALIPSFVRRSGRSDYLAGVRELAARRAASLAVPRTAAAPGAGGTATGAVTLVDHDPDAEVRVLAALLYGESARPLAELRALVASLPAEERLSILTEAIGLRRNRRDRPPRAFENVSYTFDLLGNLGLYRDLARHRLLTQERQAFTTREGYDVPLELDEMGLAPEFRSLMDRAADVYEAIAAELPVEAAYAVPFAYRVRWYVRLSLREAVHLCELRAMPQGHPDYRLIAQEMWRRIEEVHPTLGAAARFLDRDTYRLGRLQSELRTEHKRVALAGS